MRLHLFCETDQSGQPNGSAQIRWVRPLSHPSLNGEFSLSIGESLPSDARIAIVDRGWRQGARLADAEALVQQIRERRMGLIYGLDDNLLDLHRDRPWLDTGAETRKVIRYFLRQADRAVVSTQYLAERVASLAGDVCVIPNALDERLFGEPKCLERGKDGTGVIGYMGTHSHLDDLMLVLEPLRKFLRATGGRWEFQLVGISPDDRILRAFDGLRFKVLNAGDSYTYERFIPWARENLRWDIGIAPLVDSLFTRAKSDIKYLDYALLGIPGIYSALEPYKNVPNGICGLLAENRGEAWMLALQKMSAESVYRESIRTESVSHVKATRILSRCAIIWKNVIMELAEKLELNTISAP